MIDIQLFSITAQVTNPELEHHIISFEPLAPTHATHAVSSTEQHKLTYRVLEQNVQCVKCRHILEKCVAHTCLHCETA
jgi:hypothetical protein